MSLSITFGTNLLGVTTVWSFVGFGATESTSSFIDSLFAIGFDLLYSITPIAIGFLGLI